MTATGRKKIDELYHPACERSEFYSMSDLAKPPVLFSPAEDSIDKVFLKYNLKWCGKKIFLFSLKIAIVPLMMFSFRVKWISKIFTDTTRIIAILLMVNLIQWGNSLRTSYILNLPQRQRSNFIIISRLNQCKYFFPTKASARKLMFFFAKF